MPTPTVPAFLATLDHPLKPEIEAVRQAILGADPTIGEAIKWNAPSFRTTEFFATFHLRARDRVQLVLHTGAKAKARAERLDVPDPAGLLAWLAQDRAMVELGRGAELEARLPALRTLVRAWISHL